MRLFPKNEDFFALFEKQAKQLSRAIDLANTLDGDTNMKELTINLKKVEHEADGVTHEIIKKLNSSFITPFDREDIAYLASNMDDVIDELERAINRMYIYKISPDRREILQYINLIDKSIEHIIKGIKELRSRKNHEKLLHYSEIINFLENQTDDLHRDTLTELFEKQKNPITVIKLREIYDAFETVTDRCEDVANCFESLVIKNM